MAPLTMIPLRARRLIELMLTAPTDVLLDIVIDVQRGVHTGRVRTHSPLVILMHLQSMCPFHVAIEVQQLPFRQACAASVWGSLDPGGNPKP